MELLLDDNNFNEANIKSHEADLKIIRVIGVGGAGGNAVNHMVENKMPNVSFIACNTDRLALEKSLADRKVLLGPKLNKGLGAGNKPEQGKRCAIESEKEIAEILDGAEIVFIAAGLGGGTGTGASPHIAQMAKERGILTIAVVTIPEQFEGRGRLSSVTKGVSDLYQYVDSMLIINCDIINDVLENKHMMFEDVLKYIDSMLTKSVKAISGIVSEYARVQLDIADLRTAMSNSGMCFIGIGQSSGPDRAKIALNDALTAPLLRHQDIKGAKHILVNISLSPKAGLKQSERQYILSEITKASRDDEYTLMWGYGYDEMLDSEDDEGALRVTVIITGFKHGIFDDSTNKDSSITFSFNENGNFEMKQIRKEPTEEKSEEEIQERKEIDKKLAELYSKKSKFTYGATAPKVKQYSDPVIIPIEYLKNKDLYKEFYEIPAYTRRSVEE